MGHLQGMGIPTNMTEGQLRKLLSTQEDPLEILHEAEAAVRRYRRNQPIDDERAKFEALLRGEDAFQQPGGNRIFPDAERTMDDFDFEAPDMRPVDEDLLAVEPPAQFPFVRLADMAFEPADPARNPELQGMLAEFAEFFGVEINANVFARPDDLRRLEHIINALDGAVAGPDRGPEETYLNYLRDNNFIR